MIHVSNVEVLEMTVDRDRSMSVERKVQLGEGDISGVREAPLLPVSVRLNNFVYIVDFNGNHSAYL
jgi:hypothetical protein